MAELQSESNLARIAHLAAILCRDGATESNLLFVADLPSINNSMSEMSGLSGAETDRASTQFAVLDRDIYLRQSAFADPSFRSDLDRSLSVNYKNAGLAGLTVPVDHLSAQLLYLSVLLEKSSENCELFVHDYLLSWFPPVYEAICRRRDKVDMVGMVLCVQLLGHLGTGRAGSVLSTDENPDTPTLKNIARDLASPNVCGMFFHRDDLVTIARRSEIPLGFGSRLNMIDTLLDSAMRYGKLPPILEGLSMVLLEAIERYVELDLHLRRPNQENVWIGIASTMVERLDRFGTNYS